MIWINEQGGFDRAMDRIAAQSVIAVDTEADSLHSYFDKVCLIQISIEGEDFIIDPLSRIDLKRFGEVLANPSITKVLHGGDYDLRILNRDFGFTMASLIDTSICAQLLGYPQIGLAALLERHFGVKLNKVHQRADWSMRPLSPDMLAYAAMDTHYLIELAGKLRVELEALGRWEWAIEEFERLSMVRFSNTAEDPEPWRKMKNIGTLDRRALGVIRDLHAWRDKLARAADRPPFKIIGNDAIIDLAKTRPQTHADLTKMKSISRYHGDRYGRDLVAMIRRVADLDESELPERGAPKPWIRDKELENRVEKLKKLRDKIAADLKIDPAVLAPRHVLTALAQTRDFAQVPAMREWQKRQLSEAFKSLLTQA